MPQVKGKVVGRDKDGNAIVELADGRRVTTSFDQISLAGGVRPDAPPTITDRLKGMLPEIVGTATGVGVGLAGAPTGGVVSIAAPAAAAGATTLLRDWLDPNEDVNVNNAMGHALLNAAPGVVGAGLKGGATLRTALALKFPALARIIGTGGGSGAAKATATAAPKAVKAVKEIVPQLGDIELANGVKAGSEQGIQQLMAQQGELFAKGKDAAGWALDDLIKRLQAEIAKTAATPLGAVDTLKSVGIRSSLPTAAAATPAIVDTVLPAAGAAAGAVAPTSNIPAIVNGLRALITAGSAGRDPGYTPQSPRRRAIGGAAGGGRMEAGF